MTVELKSTKARYGTIQARIHEAIVKAKAQDAVKENFVVNLGNRRLSAKLRGQLEQYNKRNTLHPLARLWVMANGVFEEINLRK